MSYETLPIVGAFYRPPAKSILSVLPPGTPLFIVAESDNQFDPNAVAVWITTEEIPIASHATLEVDLMNFGLDLDAVLSVEQWHLGYIPKEFAARLKAEGVITNDEAVDVTFSLSPSGKPYVRFAAPVL